MVKEVLHNFVVEHIYVGGVILLHIITLQEVIIEDCFLFSNSVHVSKSFYHQGTYDGVVLGACLLCTHPHIEISNKEDLSPSRE